MKKAKEGCKKGKVFLTCKSYMHRVIAQEVRLTGQVEIRLRGQYSRICVYSKITMYKQRCQNLIRSPVCLF